MTSDRERQQWTEWAEIRQRQQNQTPRKPRAKKQSGSTAAQLEAALDDLTSPSGTGTGGRCDDRRRQTARAKPLR
jgi:hypothetical protein